MILLDYYHDGPMSTSDAQTLRPAPPAAIVRVATRFPLPKPVPKFEAPFFRKVQMNGSDRPLMLACRTLRLDLPFNDTAAI